MSSFPRFVVETRELADTPDEKDRRQVELALKGASKKDVSATRVGDVTACVDERGTSVLVGPSEKGAHVRVTVSSASRRLAAMGAGFAIAALFSVLISALLPAKAIALGSVAVAMAVFAALMLVSSRVGIWRAKKRAAEVADAVVAALPRVRVEVDDEEEEEEEAAPAGKKRRRA